MNTNPLQIPKKEKKRREHPPALWDQYYPAIKLNKIKKRKLQANIFYE